FWSAVALELADETDTGVLMFDLVNEPTISLSANCWLMGAGNQGPLGCGVPFGGGYFVQHLYRNGQVKTPPYIGINGAVTNQQALAVDWISRMSAAIKEVDADRLITM